MLLGDIVAAPLVHDTCEMIGKGHDLLGKSSARTRGAGDGYDRHSELLPGVLAVMVGIDPMRAEIGDAGLSASGAPRQQA